MWKRFCTNVTACTSVILPIYVSLRCSRLLGCLNSNDRLVRESGCLALGRMKSKTAIKKLVYLWLVALLHRCSQIIELAWETWFLRIDLITSVVINQIFFNSVAFICYIFHLSDVFLWSFLSSRALSEANEDLNQSCERLRVHRSRLICRNKKKTLSNCIFCPWTIFAGRCLRFAIRFEYLRSNLGFTEVHFPTASVVSREDLKLSQWKSYRKKNLLPDRVVTAGY